MATCKDCEFGGSCVLLHKSDSQVCNIFTHKKDYVEVVRCKDCKHWHEETGWCTKHSHFIGFDGMACHPSQSSEWKMFEADDFCSYGERRTDGEQA